MHCKNCGAHYRTRELSCPYCGTENIVGQIWMKQVTEAEIEYERARLEADRGLPVYVMNRVLNRVLILSLGMLVLMLAVIVAVSMLDFGTLSLNRKLNAGEIAEKTEKLYQEGRLDELYTHMKDYELLYEEDDFKYAQAAMLEHDYSSFKSHRMAFLSMTEEEKQADDYQLEYSIREGFDVVRKPSGAFQSLDASNDQLYAEMAEDIYGYFRGILGMSEEEYQQYAEMEYFPSNEMDQLIRRIKERRSWK